MVSSIQRFAEVVNKASGNAVMSIFLNSVMGFPQTLEISLIWAVAGEEEELKMTLMVFPYLSFVILPIFSGTIDQSNISALKLGSK